MEEIIEEGRVFHIKTIDGRKEPSRRDFKQNRKGQRFGITKGVVRSSRYRRRHTLAKARRPLPTKEQPETKELLALSAPGKCGPSNCSEYSNV